MSLDYLVWDNTSPVIYEIGRRNPSVVDLPPIFDGKAPATPPLPTRNKQCYISTAKNRHLSKRELAASGGVYTPDDMVWILPDALFPTGLHSKPGDAVIETAAESVNALPGVRWVVLQVEWDKNRETRRLTCRDLVLAHDLREYITIERPAISYDKAGVAVKQFPSGTINPAGVILYANLPARAQLMTKEEKERYGVEGLEGGYRVIVDREIDVSKEDRILLDNGLYLDIVRYENAMRIDELPVVICERRV